MHFLKFIVSEIHFEMYDLHFCFVALTLRSLFLKFHLQKNASFLRCNNVGVRIYVDAVFNHMTASQTPAHGTAGNRAFPNALLYPGVPYIPRHFHPSCAISNYQNATEVRVCELSGLHDLDQSKPYVRYKIVSFLNEAIKYGVAGFRYENGKI